jgi:hypothetical protein
MRHSRSVRYTRLRSSLLLAAVWMVQGCEAPPAAGRGDVSPDESPGATPGDSAADDEVDLQNMLSIAGAADIRHGTGAYQAPPGAPEDEREERIFVAFLSGGQEVPAIKTKAEGAMALILNKKQDRLRFVLQHNVAEATIAHLHAAAAGESGPVAVALPNADRTSVGTLRITGQQAQDLLAGRLYVNVHSKSNGGGEIRGQILRPGETVFVATLRGSEEVPANQSVASAQASLILSAARDQIRYRVAFAGLTPTAGHLHRGIAGSNGPVAFPLAAAAGSGNEGVIEGSFAIAGAGVQDLALRQLYLNLHSGVHPAGEIRGQILRPGEAVFATTLSGLQEVPAVAAASQANAMVVLGSAGAKFLYNVTTDAAVTMAHFHRGPAGVNGPVEQPLDEIGATMTGVLDLGDARRTDIERGLWYFNVHTAANPKGELRGQLLRPGETLYTASFAGANEVPASTSTATGALALILNAERTAIRYDGAFTGVIATAAHIHDGPAGTNGPVVLPLTFSGATLSGDQAVTADLITKLNTAGLYANLHSAANPMGDVRGQITLAGAVAPAPAPTTGMTMPTPTPPVDMHEHTH